jgi:hypothetical protein
MVADISTHTYVFYVNGTAYASGAAQAFDNNVNVINRLTLATGFATGTYDVDYVDVTGS